jgi:two-component system, chemotaxis family, chemotaxis protein CheY
MPSHAPADPAPAPRPYPVTQVELGARSVGLSCAGADASPTSRTRADRPPTPSGDPSMHAILAVDDSASMRQMVSFTLKNAGFAVVEAVDGQDALDKTAGRDFSLVLTDQNMPRMDGVTLTRELRGNPRFRTTPILILSTENSDSMKQAGRAAGATGWLVKPFDPAKLVEVIGKVLR